jgi:glycosyltransferase involved in cell wall biosynthesis
MAKLCLNMIVKNEADKILRCLESVAPYIDCYAIVDTGSTDETIKTITDFFAAKAIPGAVTSVPFVNFEQARNAGLKAARHLAQSFDYIFLLDADMVLEVTDVDFKDHLSDVAYDILQKAGGISYFNRRLIRRDQTGGYVGVTHEYLNVPGGGQLTGVQFTDYADGSNRKNKFKRDIKLLLKALKKEPDNGRYVYYLAQSYRDAGQAELAASSYHRRMEMGGWDEEVWSARINYAHCLMALGDKDGFIREMLAAYNFRPTRAETLYDLAKHYRDKGDQNTSLLFSVEGMKIPYPADLLFVTDHVYKTGLRDEFSICAFYNPVYRKQGYKVCSEIAIDIKAGEGSRELARGNLFHYIQPLKDLCPSFTPQRIDFTPPDGFIAMNPSIARINGTLHVVVRSVNYTMDEAGRYLIKGIDINSPANNSNPIHTRNHLILLHDNLRVANAVEILAPAAMPAPAYKLVVGFEDMRIFEWNKEIWSLSNLREMNAEGWCEQTLGRLEPHTTGYRVSDDFKRILPAVRQHEKNWMPWVDGQRLDFVYRVGRSTVTTNGELKLADPPAPFATDCLSGGSQVISFKGGWLAIVHESRIKPGGKRYYQHRFVWWDAAHILRKISPAFVLHDRQIEFAAGLAWQSAAQDKLVISYGIDDREAWLATIDWYDVIELLEGHL